MASANRAMRRRQAKAEQKAAQLFKNGITEKELIDQFSKGYRAGFQDRAWQIVRAYYASTMLALHDEYGFGQARCIKVLKRVEENLINFLSNQELIEEVENKLKIEINIDEAMDRVSPK